MAHIPAKLINRLIQLESRMAPRFCSNYISVMESIPEERRCTLQPGERIVLDYYRHRGFLIEARERITTDPRDLGRRCEPERYLLEVVAEIHNRCLLRGELDCHVCFGTPVSAT